LGTAAFIRDGVGAGWANHAELGHVGWIGLWGCARGVAWGALAADLTNKIIVGVRKAFSFIELVFAAEASNGIPATDLNKKKLTVRWAKVVIRYLEVLSGGRIEGSVTLPTYRCWYLNGL